MAFSTENQNGGQRGQNHYREFGGFGAIKWAEIRREVAVTSNLMTGRFGSPSSSSVSSSTTPSDPEDDDEVASDDFLFRPET